MTTTTEVRAEASISLTDSEECAIDIALQLINNELDRAVIVFGETAEDVELRTQRDALRELQAPWHRAVMIAKRGQLHTADCGWCQDGAE